jgi:tetratricopeptide (TPR) repeat protein
LEFLGDYPYRLANIYSNLATIEMYSGNFKDAVTYYENSLNYLNMLYQDNPDAYCFDLGRVQLNLCILYSQYLNDQDKARNYCDMAIASFEHAVRLNEAYKSYLSLAFNSKAYSYAYSEDYVQAIMIFDECIARWPDDANIYDSKGEVFLMLEQYEQAKQMWDKVMELDPDFLKTHQSTLYTKLKEMGMIS